jgi:hypothetical protein
MPDTEILDLIEGFLTNHFDCEEQQADSGNLFQMLSHISDLVELRQRPFPSIRLNGHN